MSTQETNRVIARAVTMALVGVVTLYGLYLLRGVLLMLYISLLFAIGFTPAVQWLERKRFMERRRRLPRWFAILVLYVGGLAIIALILGLVIPPLIGQLNQLWENLPAYVDRLQVSLVERGLIERRWTWSELVKNTQIPSVALSGLLGALQGVLGALGAIVTVLLLPFYLLLETDQLRRALLRFVNEDSRPLAGRIMRDVTDKVGAWLTGQALLSLVIGATAALGMWLLGIPYFYVIGLIAAVGEAIPVIGPILAAIPAIFLGWTVSGNTALLVAGYFMLQQFIENNVLVPHIMGRQVGVSAVTILVALLVGSELLGFVGAILAVPTAAIIQVVLQEYLERDDE